MNQTSQAKCPHFEMSRFISDWFSFSWWASSLLKSGPNSTPLGCTTWLAAACCAWPRGVSKGVVLSDRPPLSMTARVKLLMDAFPGLPGNQSNNNPPGLANSDCKFYSYHGLIIYNQQVYIIYYMKTFDFEAWKGVTVLVQALGDIQLKKLHSSPEAR